MAGAVSAAGVGGVAGRLSQPASADIAAATETANSIERGVMVLTWNFIAISWFNEWTAIRAIDAPGGGEPISVCAGAARDYRFASV